MHATECTTGYAAERAAPPANEALGVALLARAHNAIAGGLERASQGETDHPLLDDLVATFVTLRIADALRGCIGTLQPHRTLDEDVRANAWAAAFRDPRFAPLQSHEFDCTTIEVALLQPPQALEAASESAAAAALRPHVDGLIVSWRSQRATFLPQVWDTLPDPLDFLRQLKRKAGLPHDFWAAELRLQTYSVTKFVSQRAQLR
jgi:AmmeMemoRadiSam system protein A